MQETHTLRGLAALACSLYIRDTCLQRLMSGVLFADRAPEQCSPPVGRDPRREGGQLCHFCHLCQHESIAESYGRHSGSVWPHPDPTADSGHHPVPR